MYRLSLSKDDIYLLFVVMIYMAVFPRTLAMFFLLHHGEMFLRVTFHHDVVNPPERRGLLTVTRVRRYATCTAVYSCQSVNHREAPDTTSVTIVIPFFVIWI